VLFFTPSRLQKAPKLLLGGLLNESRLSAESALSCCNHFRLWNLTLAKKTVFLTEDKPASGEYEELICEPAKCNYYLLGFWRSKQSRFSEPRLRKVLNYPVNDPKEMDRAYVVVNEYRPAKPGMDTSMTDFMECLNRPRVLAHRLLAVKTGRDWEEKIGIAKARQSS
jgi:hypothetical protein